MGKYLDVALMGLIVIMAIPMFLFLIPFAIIGCIICKIFKINPDEIRYLEYD